MWMVVRRLLTMIADCLTLKPYRSILSH